MRLRTSIENKLLAVCILISFSSLTQAKILGTVGKTYQIAEKDAVEELEKKASSIDFGRMMSSVKPGKYRPQDLTNLPRARKPNTRLVDMTYTLDADIVDSNGSILYPKGYTFNPLDYLQFNKTIVVINGEDHSQVEWFSRSKYHKQPDSMLCLTAGSVVELRKRLRRPVFYATNAILGRFSIKSVPSVVSRQGRMMEVAEVELPSTRKSKEITQ